MAAITLISNFVRNENYLSSSLTVIFVCSFTAFLSITTWTFFGKFLRKFATNNNFIKRFNYAMSSATCGLYNRLLYLIKMKPGIKNSYKSLKTITINGSDYKYYSLVEAEKNGLTGISKLPKSLKVLVRKFIKI